MTLIIKILNAECRIFIAVLSVIMPSVVMALITILNAECRINITMLTVIMPSVVKTFLSILYAVLFVTFFIVMLSNESCIRPGFIMLSFIMLSVILQSADCRYLECHFTDCRGVINLPNVNKSFSFQISW
jgi:hypothetical protein